MFRNSFLLICLIVPLSIFCQIDDQHIYIPETIQSPKEADMVKGFEGFPSIPFLANNLKGEEVNLFELRGKTVLLYFWDSSINNSLNHLATMNSISALDGIEIVSFSIDSKSEARSATQKFENRNFHVIANSKTLAEGPYGSELGCPKLFIIDEFGVIKHVLPQSFFDSTEVDHNEHILSLIKNL